MFTSAAIAFREFLEAFLIIGVFLGISKKLNLKKEFEIGIAVLIGLVIALTLPLATYFLGGYVRHVLTEKSAEYLESYLLIFSGFFIAYVVLSLHSLARFARNKSILQVHQKLENNIFDISLVLMVIFLIIREGAEIALFTATTSLFSTFTQNILGLMIGFAAAATIGVSVFFSYLRFPISKIFKVTEGAILLFGAAFLQNGLTQLAALYFKIHLSTMFAIRLWFLPESSTLAGHFVKNMTGLDREFSFVRLGIMILYVIAVSFFLRNKPLQKGNMV